MMGNIRVYIAGPITGIKNYNKLAFDAAEERLSGLNGFTPMNPLSEGLWLKEKRLERGEEEPTWEEYMRMSITLLLRCGMILLLPGWQESRGARLEAKIASEIGIEEFKFEDFDLKGREHVKD